MTGLGVAATAKGKRIKFQEAAALQRFSSASKPVDPVYAAIEELRMRQYEQMGRLVQDQSHVSVVWWAVAAGTGALALITEVVRRWPHA